MAVSIKFSSLFALDLQKGVSPVPRAISSRAIDSCCDGFHSELGSDDFRSSGSSSQAAPAALSQTIRTLEDFRPASSGSGCFVNEDIPKFPPGVSDGVPDGNPRTVSFADHSTKGVSN